MLGDPTPLACTVATAVVDAVLGGDSLDGLTRWIEPQLRTAIKRQRSLARRAGRTGASAIVLRARVCRVNALAAEVSLVVEHDQRARAVAMRLEDSAGRWLVTAVDVG